MSVEQRTCDQISAAYPNWQSSSWQTSSSRAVVAEAASGGTTGYKQERYDEIQ